MGDVFPRRNLGAGEYWGRTVESRIENAEKLNSSGALQLSGINRSNSSSQSDLAQILIDVQEQLAASEAQLAATRALANQLPASGSASSYASNFGLITGWQTITATNIPVPAGRNNLSILATAVCRVEDSGTGGGGGGGGGFRWPFPTSTVTSEYGPRDGRMHEGIDFGVAQGTPIPASNAGTVTGNGFGSGTGWYVDITHPGNIRTRYFHMVAQSDIPIGTVVEKSQTIGFVGNTGNSFGAHLHWETIVNGTHQNPRDFMAVYGDGGSGGSSGGTITFARPKARITINGGYSREFFPHRNFSGPSNASTTLNQIFPQHGVNTFDNYVSVTVEIYAEADVAASPGNFARLTTFGVFQP